MILAVSTFLEPPGKWKSLQIKNLELLLRRFPGFPSLFRG